jgi:hypothetical protein
MFSFAADGESNGRSFRKRQAHLRRVLVEFAAYYNGFRIHHSLSKDAPFHRTIEHVGSITSRPILGGLHPILPTLTFGISDEVLGTHNAPGGVAGGERASLSGADSALDRGVCRRFVSLTPAAILS